MIASLIVCLGATADAPWCTMNQYDSFQIVVAPSAIEREQEAARELQRYWELATGHTIPVSEKPGDGINVWIGRDGVPADYYDPSELEGLSHDGFFLRSVSPTDLIIIGARPYGTLFGVYQFLEDYLGIRWLTPQDTYIPR